MSTQYTRRPVGFALMAASVLTIGTLLSTTFAAVAGEAGMRERYARPDPYRLEQRYNLVKSVQSALTERGYDPGPIDGLYGSRTAAALLRYQQDNGLPGDGHITADTIRHLGLR